MLSITQSKVRQRPVIAPLLPFYCSSGETFDSPRPLQTNSGELLNNGQLNTVLDDARTDGIAGETGGVVDVELLHEMLAMFLDGLDADAEL